MRMIVEGIENDENKLRYLSTKTSEYHSDVDIISRVGLNGTFFLVGTYIDDKLNIYHRQDSDWKISKQVFLCDFPRIPQTMILEDGRIYSCAKKERLERTLKEIFHEKGGFDKAYNIIGFTQGFF